MEQLVTTVRQRSWLEMIRQRKASGLSVKEWCLANNISENCYYYRLHKLRKVIGNELPQFVELSGPVPVQTEQISAPPLSTRSEHAAIVICEGQLRIEISCDASPTLVETIVRSLHA